LYERLKRLGNLSRCPRFHVKRRKLKRQFRLQENGQRRLTAPKVARGERQHGKSADIFLGRLPHDCYKDELMSMLGQVGRLLELRLMLDFSESMRGYTFALFAEPRIAREACARLDSYEIRPDHRIGVVKSMDNYRLFFGEVPKTKTKLEFLEELTKILDGITDIYLFPSAHEPQPRLHLCRVQGPSGRDGSAQTYTWTSNSMEPRDRGRLGESRTGRSD